MIQQVNACRITMQQPTNSERRSWHQLANGCAASMVEQVNACTPTYSSQAEKADKAVCNSWQLAALPPWFNRSMPAHQQYSSQAEKADKAVCAS
jgi:hypothetical protein